MKKYWKIIVAVVLVVATAITVSTTSVNWKMKATDDGGYIGGVDTVEQTIILEDNAPMVMMSAAVEEEPFIEEELTEDALLVEEAAEPVAADASQKELVLTVNNYSGLYDGSVHGAAASVDVAEGTTVSYSTDGGATWSSEVPTIKDAGAISVMVKAENPDYISSTASYTLEVLKRNIIFASDSAGKVYDGEPLTMEGISVGGDGFAEGEDAIFTFGASQTKVGTCDNVFTYEFDTNTKADNYDVTVNYGLLEILAAEGEIIVSTPSQTFVYDGQPHGTTVNVVGVPEEYTVSETVSTTTVTHVADGEVTALADGLVILNAEGEDVTELLGITYDLGTISIVPAELTVVTESAEKTYDGTPLSAGGYISGLVNDETVTFEVVGSQTGVGSSINAYVLVWDGTAAMTDYDIVGEFGNLVVKAPIEEEPVIDTPEDTDNPVQPPVSSSLVIRYVYPDGSTAAPAYVGTYTVGQAYGPIYSPSVAGSIADTLAIGDGVSTIWQYGYDVEVTVVYSPIVTEKASETTFNIDTVKQFFNRIFRGFNTTRETKEAGKLDLNKSTGEMTIVSITPPETPTGNIDLDNQESVLRYAMAAVITVALLVSQYM